MTEIVLCNRPIAVQSLQDQCGTRSCHAQSSGGRQMPKILTPYRPYAVEEVLTPESKQLLATLNGAKDCRNMTELAISLGAEKTLALAESRTNSKSSA